MKFLQFVLIILVASTTITSCVSTKKFHDIQAKNAELLSNEKECFDDMDNSIILSQSIDVLYQYLKDRWLYSINIQLDSDDELIHTLFEG